MLKTRKHIKRFFYVLIIGVIGLSAFKADDYFEISKNLDIFAAVYKEVNTSYVDDVQPGELIRAAIDGMLKSLDPYTTFYSEAQKEDYEYQVTGTYAGVGSTVRTIGDYVYFDSPYNDYPAFKAGILPGDKILAIDGEDMKGKNTETITDFLRGNAGTTINVKIERVGSGEMTLPIKRGQVKIKNVPYFGMLENNVGYLKLTGFTTDASKEVRDAVVELKDQGATSILLDLRNNGGGLLYEAINIVNVFIKKGEKILETKGKFEEDNHVYKTLNPAVDTEIPLAIMINGYSASASEVVSGSLQDLDRAVLIGRNSYGKGLVQSTKPLTYNTQMKVTTAKYYIPSGRLIQRLDYGNKKDGKAVEVADTLKAVFYTRNKREVIDGEGIQPDVKVEGGYYADISSALMENDLFFLFANEFRSKNKTIVKAIDFDVSEELYADFEKFIRDKDYDYTTYTEEYLDDLKEQAKDDKYYDLLETELNSLTASLTESKKKDLQTNKQEIKDLIEYQIAKRYYFDDGRVEVQFDDDPDMDKAIEILSDQPGFKVLLGY